VARLLGLAGFALMGLTAYLYFNYADTRPTTPVESEGRTSPLNVHGRVVYLTGREQLGLYILEGFTLGVGATFIAVVQLRLKRTY
jgi:hypothetical protein